MIGSLSNWQAKMFTITGGVHRGGSPTMRILGLLLSSILILGVLSGCAATEDKTPTAQEQLCTNLSNLQDSIKTLLSRDQNKDLSTFRSNWNQVKTDFDSVKTSAQQVASANIDPVTTSFDALVSAVQNALSAGGISAALDSIQTAANNFVDAVRTAISDFNCSS